MPEYGIRQGFSVQCSEQCNEAGPLDSGCLQERQQIFFRVIIDHQAAKVFDIGSALDDYIPD
jgi:hypothetical protein